MTRPHGLKEALELSSEAYEHLREYALGRGLAVEDRDERQLLAQIREKLCQSKGITDAIERR